MNIRPGGTWVKIPGMCAKYTKARIVEKVLDPILSVIELKHAD
jgi:hypothetical protein